MKQSRVPYRNNEGYPDPTASEALNTALNDSWEADERTKKLIGAIKSMIDLAGYDLLQRIEVMDRKTGRIYR